MSVPPRQSWRDQMQPGLMKMRSIQTPSLCIRGHCCCHLAPLAEMIADHGLADCGWDTAYVDARTPALISAALPALCFTCATQQEFRDILLEITHKCNSAETESHLLKMLW